MTLSRSNGRALLSITALAIIIITGGLIYANSRDYKDYLNLIVADSYVLRTIDLNRASYTELLEIPGIGPTLAQRILSYRMLHGPVQTWDGLDQIRGIGPATIEKIRKASGVCLGIECNTR